MEGKLRRFGKGAAENQKQRGQIKRAVTQYIAAAHQHRQLRDAAYIPDEDQPGEQQKAATARHHQRLQRGTARSCALMVEADQQEGGDRGEFPEDEQHQQAVGNDDAEHRSHEQKQEGQETALLRMAFHITARIKHDQQPDAGDEQRKGERQAVDEPGEAEIEARHPGITAGHHAACRDLGQHQRKMHEGESRRDRQNPCRIVTEPFHQGRRGKRCQKRQKQRQECQRRDI
ncbi:hypothetical protein D3C72_1682620 [compost metagenome]